MLWQVSMDDGYGDMLTCCDACRKEDGDEYEGTHSGNGEVWSRNGPLTSGCVAFESLCMLL